MVKYCHNCGHKMEDNEHFCSKCGQKAIELNKDYLQRMEEEKKSSNDLYDDNSSKNINSFNYNSYNSSSNSNSNPNTDSKTNSNDNYNGNSHTYSNQNVNTNSSNASVNSNKTAENKEKKGSNRFCCKTLLILLIAYLVVAGIMYIMEYKDAQDS